MNKLLIALVALLTLPVTGLSEQTGSTLSESEGGFSYSPPPGWKIAEFPGLKYKISIGPATNGFSPNINVVDEAFSGSLDAYVKGNVKTMETAFEQFKNLGKTKFKTKSGLEGFKLVTEAKQQGMLLRQTFYFFARKDGKKLVATCSIDAKDADKFASVFDAAMSTFAVTK